MTYTDSDTVFTLIKSHLSEKKPLSLIRLGDGEMMVLNGFNDPESYDKVLVRQLGDGVGFKDAILIRSNLIEAINNADILGLPFGKEGKGHGKYWDSWQETLDTYAPKWRAKQHCHIDVHNHFLDKGYFTELLTGMETVNIITCRKELKERIQVRFGVKTVNLFRIPPEIAFTTYKDPKNHYHYPHYYIHMERDMDSTDLAGGFCMVGAGFVGKNYNNFFRDRGCVSMDCGNVLDAWAGKRTRGKGRGRDVEFNDFKL